VVLYDDPGGSRWIVEGSSKGKMCLVEDEFSVQESASRSLRILVVVVKFHVLLSLRSRI
jgi:hypothetical protein